MTNNKRLAYVFTSILALLLVACEKPLVENEQEKVKDTDGITLIFEAPTAEPYAEIGGDGNTCAIKNAP